VEYRAALHFDRRAGVVRQHEHVAMIGRLIAPPAFPTLVRPGAADRAKHVAPQNPGADILKAARGEIIVEPGRAVILAGMHLLKRSGRKHPFMQRHAADAHRVVDALVRTGAIAVGRHAETADHEFGWLA
jgi:hypothetical protein